MITQRALQSYSGTEMYTAEIARALKARGHEVAVFCPLPGKIGNLITPSGITVNERLEDVPFRPEVIHGHHHLPLMAALAHFSRTPAVHLWHGARPWVEQVPRHPRIARHIVTSERMAPRIQAEFGVPANLVRTVPNFVDTGRYSHVRDPSARPLRAVLFGQGGFFPAELSVLEKACADNGLTLDKVGYAYGNPRPRPEYFLPDYDIAFAIGRSALEALASGCAVIPIVPQLAGHRITAETLREWSACNFSPRYYTSADRFDSAWLARQLADWDPDDVAQVTAEVRRVYTLERGIDQLEALYDEAIALPGSGIDAVSGYASYLGWMAREADALWAQTITDRQGIETLRSENKRLKAELQARTKPPPIARPFGPPAPLPSPVGGRNAPRLTIGLEAARRARIEASGLFDAVWYRRCYPDAIGQGTDPLAHYLNDGWREGRSPSAFFDSNAYLTANPELMGQTVSPLEHYLSKLDALGAALRQEPGL
ncbi:glycosyltransferase family 4 protein [Tropicibacter oceani]|uniref:Glycosyltransferase family 4 protein n=1 Tax=Tropicibacter oceani TaxID=3058420 RepID=A0ABY8QDD0_9RHOB|nr:glycosyltransferase family 4 protein [Tropicibacter oceani]WGW02632.1 glycosyltransferase family 4 protein [Tropicibacter oceani]